jgi:catechol 2,3-dioxygenase-like lactoylglutathione lyase family enzyme
MFSHLTIGTRDLARAIAFYDAVLTPLGIERLPERVSRLGSSSILRSALLPLNS